jgi:hypothetical protein
MSEQGSVLGKPSPVHTVKNQIGELSDSGMTEVLAAGQNPTQKYGGIHRRDFGVKHALAGLRVGEVVEKSAMVGQLPPQEAQGGEDSLQRIGGSDEAPLLSNAERGETEAGGRNAGCSALIVGVNIAAVFNHTGVRAALFPEKKDACFLYVIQQLIVFG